MIDESLRSGSLTLGGHGEAFEESFARSNHSLYAVATSSGTSALEIIFRSCAITGHEVVVPANTFFASAAAVVHAGGRPRLADVSPSTMAMTAETVSRAITPATTAVLMVHLGGQITSDVEDIRRLCDARGLLLIEDAAHAHGSTFRGRSPGSFGHAAAFSFYPTKVITSAEGGMIVTEDVALRDRARVFRDQGKDGFLGGRHIEMGYAWRMSEVHAAIGRVHLQHLAEFVAARRRIAVRYRADLSHLDGLTLLAEAEGSASNCYKFPVLLDQEIERREFRRRLLDDHGVSCAGEVYATPLHREPVFAGIATAEGTGPLSVAEDVCARHVCLPLHTDLSPAEVDQVISAVSQVATELASS
jgi:perosamine synthetase